MAKEADYLAEEAQEYPQLISRLGQVGSQRVGFIRLMAMNFVQEFGNPLYRTLVSFCSVSLLDDI